ncbi:hypothetical protein HU200_020309 [Digitaria exilis]|uniref:F-box domain-containing protein n=1 Tax=Digitaria exilis TaxID=1010633 RepID=A0A835F1Q2_9POAL|nr:hypothetical protein HU200_020309 [Digitaria exilis]
MARQALAPELADDLVPEIHLRLTPDNPACLLHASLVCKRWRNILTDPEIRRRHRTIHQAPFVLGFLRIVRDAMPCASHFVSISPASRRPASHDLPRWLALGCRHGRALFATPAPDNGTKVTLDFIVWDPLTDERRRLPLPSPMLTGLSRFNAAVLCDAASEGYDHRGCHKGPFRVVFIFKTMSSTSVRMYSSTTDGWSERICIRQRRLFVDMKPCPNTLLGDVLYFRGLEMCGFEYQLSAQRLSVISQPCSSMTRGIFISLISTDDGELCFANLSEDPLCLCL